MSGARRVWLIALREMRERARSRAFLFSLGLMVIAVAAMIVLPAVLTGTGGTRDIGVTGSLPSGLTTAIDAQGSAVGITTSLHRYGSVSAGEAAVRQGEVNVLVVDGARLEWRRRADEQLRAVLTGAIQLVAVQQRATNAGIDPRALTALLAPTPVSNVELGAVAGRGPDDEAAVSVMTVVLLLGISTYGALVLTGVVEEKSSRVVEVLLARVPARDLLAGKIAGIGLLGLAQIGVTAVVALVAVNAVPNAGVPAVRPAVMAWLVLWFVLGYLLYATAFGVLGSLASRAEDAQGAAGSVTATLVVAYFLSFLAVGQPDSVLAQVASLLPITAPMAMPSRIAMGAAGWWEPIVAALLALLTIAGLVRVGGRVYLGAILRTGPTLTLRQAWSGAAASGGVMVATPGSHGGGRWWQRRQEPVGGGHPTAPSSGVVALPMYQWIGRGALLGGALGFVLAHGVGVAVGAVAGSASGAVAARAARIWADHGHRPAH